MRMRKKKHTDDRLHSCDRIYIEQPTVWHGKWNTLSDGRPILLEIGCGKGSFICETAKRNPDNFYIAVEKVRDVLVMAMEKAEAAGLTNVVFSDIDAERLEDVFAKGELAAIYLNFSDPWPKKKHASRRLTHRSFLSIYRSILAPNGNVYFKTDNRPLFDFSLEEMREADYELSELTYDLHNSEYAADNIVTEYEANFSAKGFSINRVVAHPKPIDEQRTDSGKVYMFDLDGTLVDSMGAWAQTMLRVLEADHVSYPDDIINTVTPMGNIAAAELFSKMGVHGTPEEILARISEYAVPEYTYRIFTKAGVSEYLQQLKREGHRLAVLTASPHITTDVCLKRNGIYGLFEKVWTVGDLGMVKSDPNIYLSAAERLGVRPEDITFFDDNRIALGAAKKAGLTCVGVYDASSEAYVEEIQTIADKYIRSFEELVKEEKSEAEECKENKVQE